MSRFSEVIYDAEAQTVDIGAGLIWDDVYAALEPFNVSVVGGRVTGVGVAGFILGGGPCFLLLAVHRSESCPRLFVEDEPIWPDH